MATPNEKLAKSLKVLKELQDQGLVALKSNYFTRTHRERLVKHNFLQEILNGWYIVTPHDLNQGDSSSWYTSYWKFCAEYLDDRFGDKYCISAEQSLMLHAGNDSIPSQMVIRADKATNGITNFPFSTSLFVMPSTLQVKAEIVVLNDLRALSISSALIYATPSIFTTNPIEVKTVLSMFKDASEILALLLESGHSVKAGRLVGAFRNVGQVKIADEILKTMKSLDYDVREVDPFLEKEELKISLREQSPYATRIRLLWQEMRKTILQNLPKQKFEVLNKEAYHKQIDDIYVTDAYHSLSIEKYKVTPELIERVRSGQWDLKENEADKQQRDAMAARGYWLAFNEVKKSISAILDGQNPGKIVDEQLSNWYRELFAPSVAVGLLNPADLAGYRRHQVYIVQSKHVPLNVDAIRDVMPVFFELLAQEENAFVRAILAHFIFVYIHPYMDGNGRIGRFLMNTMLISGNYPWIVIPLEKRQEYMNALEQASVHQDILPLTNFLLMLLEASANGTPIAQL
jgi:hypothetical protein